MGTAIGTNFGLGIGEESAYGTYDAPDQWHELLSESIERQHRTLQSEGVRTGTRNLRRGSRRRVTANWAAGDVTLEMARAGTGRLLKHILGGVPVSAQQGVTDAWLHTFAMGSLAGLSLTMQKIFRDPANANVGVFSASGGKVTSARFSLGVDQFLQLALSMDFRRMVTAEAAGVPAWTNPELWAFDHAAITLAGAPVARCLSAELSIDNAQDTEKFYIGSAGLKAEPGPSGYPGVSGRLDAEFAGPTELYNAFAADTALDFEVELTGDVIDAPHSERLTIRCREIHLEGGTPTLSGQGPIRVQVPFVGLYDGTNPGVEAELMSTDIAV